MKKYGLSHLTSAVSKEYSWGEVLKELYKLKSLVNFSVRELKWNLPKHVNDSYASGVLCRFRTGNAGLGNRTPTEFGFMAKTCLLCAEQDASFPLNETHVAFECRVLQAKQVDVGLQDYSNRRGSDLRLYLGGDKCSYSELLVRGSALAELLDEYLQKVKALSA